MVSTEFKGVGLHYTAFRDAIREDSRQTTPSRGVTPRKKFAAEANVESRANPALGNLPCQERDGYRVLGAVLPEHRGHRLRRAVRQSDRASELHHGFDGIGKAERFHGIHFPDSR